jgi:hypothetical protein
MSGNASVLCEISEGLVDQRVVNFAEPDTQHTREKEECGEGDKFSLKYYKRKVEEHDQTLEV